MEERRRRTTVSKTPRPPGIWLRSPATSASKKIPRKPKKERRGTGRKKGIQDTPGQHPIQRGKSNLGHDQVSLRHGKFPLPYSQGSFPRHTPQEISSNQNKEENSHGTNRGKGKSKHFWDHDRFEEKDDSAKGTKPSQRVRLQKATTLVISSESPQAE